jgi:prophage antirepressor-like protein
LTIGSYYLDFQKQQNMDLVKIFESNNLSHQVRILGTNEDPLVPANDLAAILNIKNISSAVENFENDEKTLIDLMTQVGLRKALALTEKGLYRLLFTTRSNVGKEFRDWVFNVLKELRLNGVVTLETVNRITAGHYEETIQRSRVLVDRFSGEKCFYLIKVGDLAEDKIVYKIGQTYGDISQRLASHSKEYAVLNPKEGRATLQDAWICQDPKEFESKMKMKLLPYKFGYTNSETGKTADELVLVDNVNLTKSRLFSLIQEQINLFHQEKNELVRLRAENELLKKINQDLINKNNAAPVPQRPMPVLSFSETFVIDIPSTPQEQKKETFQVSAKRRNTESDKIQKIHAHELNVVAVYEDLSEAMQHNLQMGRSMLKEALENTNISGGYYWKYVEPDQDDNMAVVNFNPKPFADSIMVEPVVQMNEEKTDVLAVFENRLAAARNFKVSNTHMGRVIKGRNTFRSSYVVGWSQLCAELKQKWLSRNDGVVYHKTIDWTIIENVDTKEVTVHQGSAPDVATRLHMTHDNVSKAVKSGEKYLGLKFRVEKRPLPIHENDLYKYIVYKQNAEEN